MKAHLFRDTSQHSFPIVQIAITRRLMVGWFLFGSGGTWVLSSLKDSASLGPYVWGKRRRKNNIRFHIKKKESFILDSFLLKISLLRAHTHRNKIGTVTTRIWHRSKITIKSAKHADVNNSMYNKLKIAHS